MNRLRQTVLGLLALLALCPALASAQGKAFSLGKNGDVDLASVTRIGQATLQPGHYRFQYQEQDGRHYLNIKTRNENSEAAVARVACLLLPVTEQISDTAVHTLTEPDGVRRITWIRIQGERAEHMIVVPDAKTSSAWPRPAPRHEPPQAPTAAQTAQPADFDFVLLGLV